MKTVVTKIYNLSGVGGSSQLVFTVGEKIGEAFLQGSLYQRGDGPAFKKYANGIESLLVALAARGYDMKDARMIDAINDAVEACANRAEG